MSEVRRLAMGARLTVVELDAIGVALKGRLIDPERAMQELDDLGLTNLVGVPLGPSATDEAWAASAREYAEKRGKRS
jgi:hypothetical protein